jgi:antitoxin component YwqK of YwqJK toxin-antitoxin module
VAAFKEDGSGFMEIYNENGILLEERSYSPGDISTIIRYTYRSGRLVRAEASRIHPVEPPAPEAEPPVETVPPEAGDSVAYVEEALWTDTYRYNRASALRSIERSYPGDSPEPELSVVAFPRLPGRREVTRLVSPAGYISSEFFRDIMALGGTPEFTTDERGRILTETRLDEDGEILGTFTNVWNGEQLSSVSWETEGEKRRIEFEYNPQGDRITERNYRNDILERTVQSSGNRDMEELYLNGIPVLRAVWEDGRKVSEEPLKTESGAPNAEEEQ